MFSVSLVTAPPPRARVDGNVFAASGAKQWGWSDYRLWAALLFGLTLVLWWTFR
jgi:hypothetical protein